MRLTTRGRSIATSAGIALAFAGAVAAGAFAIVTGLTPAATVPTLQREALLIERAPSQATLALEPPPAPSAAVDVVSRAPTPQRLPAVPEPQDSGAPPDEAAFAPAPAEPPRRSTARAVGPRVDLPRVDMAALPPNPQAALPSPPRAVPEPPRLTRAPVLRPRPDPRMDGVLTPDEIRRIRMALRLTPEQTPHWPAVEALLQEIGAQQVALVKAGRKAEDAFGSGLSMRIYWAARPLLGVLREDQKAKIRARAKALGLEAVASAI